MKHKTIIMYKIESLPTGWVWCPFIVREWLKNIELKGRRFKGNIYFNFKDVVEKLCDKGVPHVAQYLKDNFDRNLISFPQDGCKEI